MVTALATSLIVDATRNGGHHRDASSETTVPPGRVDLGTSATGAGALFTIRAGATAVTGGADGLRIVDTDTGAVTRPRVSGLPTGAVRLVAHSGSTFAVETQGRLAWFALSDPDPAAHFVDADAVFAGAVDDELWLASATRSVAVGAAATPRPVATDGVAFAATNAGLLVHAPTGVEVQPLDAQPSRALLPRGATVIGVHPDRVAWVTGECGALRCPVNITEIGTRTTTTWLQLPGHPTRGAILTAVGVFSPDGSRLAVVVPDPSITAPAVVLLADLTTRATSSITAGGRLEIPSRPGHVDGAGLTVSWTLDGRNVLFGQIRATAPPHLGLIEPSTPLMWTSRPLPAAAATVAVNGVSQVGALDLPRRGPLGPPAGDGPGLPPVPGLRLLAADATQVDIFDPARDEIRSWLLRGPAGQGAPGRVARIAGGWLVERASTIVRIDDTFTPPSALAVTDGDRVFASARGTKAWIATQLGGPVWSARGYDPATGALGTPVVIPEPVGAVDDGLIVPLPTDAGTELQLLGLTGGAQPGVVIGSRVVDVLAAAGSTVAFNTSRGLSTLDVRTGAMSLVTERGVAIAALSPDGRNLAWIESDLRGPLTHRLLVSRVGSSDRHQLGISADRVVVGDDGTVVFTSGTDVRWGRVDDSVSNPVFGLAPDVGITLALGEGAAAS